MSEHSRLYREYMASAAWQARRRRALQLAGYRCENCGVNRRFAYIDVHHLSYDRLGDEPDEDLMALCRTCHEAADAEREWMMRFWCWADEVYGDGWKPGLDELVTAQEDFTQWLALVGGVA